MSIVTRQQARIMLFDPCQVKYGDRFVRGRRISCGKCAAVNRIPLNTTPPGGGNDDTQVENLAARKFEKLGWRVGKRKIDMRCPECVRQEGKPFAVLEPLQTKEHTVPTKPTLVPPPATAPVTPTLVEPPKPMTRDDRRVIFAKLNEVYQDERRGYALDWSDKRVSEDLGVPRAWVVEVREQNFGPDKNAEFMEAVGLAKNVIADCKAVSSDLQKMQLRHTGEINALAARVTPLAAAMERMEKLISAIEKAVVP